jgi:hypothetical protein
MNESESRASNPLPRTQNNRATHTTPWVVLLTLPVTIAALVVALGAFGLLLRLLAQVRQ